jgi:hypothetical protein
VSASSANLIGGAGGEEDSARPSMPMLTCRSATMRSGKPDVLQRHCDVGRLRDRKQWAPFISVPGQLSASGVIEWRRALPLH